MFGISWNWSRKPGGRYGVYLKLKHKYTLVVHPPPGLQVGDKYEIEWHQISMKRTTFTGPVELNYTTNYRFPMSVWLAVFQTKPGGPRTMVYRTRDEIYASPDEVTHIYIPPWWVETQATGSYGAQTRGGLSIIPGVRPGKWGPWGTG